jgi:hypothetical protein
VAKLLRERNCLVDACVSRIRRGFQATCSSDQLLLLEAACAAT